MRLSDTIKSPLDLQQQYQDSANLNARVAIYRFSVGQGFGPFWVFDRLLEIIPPDAEVLELGCGPGAIWKKNLDRVPRGWRIQLTDLMPGMLDEARAALAGDGRFSFMQMDAHTIAFPDARFDAVIANHMLYHVDDRPRALAEIRRVLKPGGRLFASTNSENHLRKIAELFTEYLGKDSPVASGIPFSLENGEAQLRPFFSHVTLKKCSTALLVTEAEAVVQYILSVEKAKQIIVGERLDDLRRRVQSEIDTHGAFVAATEAGAFIAEKGLSA